MKIAVFYPTYNTAWSITTGVRNAFTRMGHEVLDCGSNYAGRALEEQDLIFVSGPEYFMSILRVDYPAWDSLPAKKIGWLHETVEREDYGVPRENGTYNYIAVNGRLPVEELKKFTPHLFTPAQQDQKYGLTYMPFGVDTYMFHPMEKGGVGSIYTGAMYRTRREFLEKHPEVRYLAAYREYPTIEEYAEAVAKADVVLNLPSLSDTNNTRTFEVLACRTALITSAVHSDPLFIEGKHVLYYEGSPTPAFAKLDVPTAEKIAWQGYKEVLEKHTIEDRLQQMLKKVFSKPLRLSRFSRKR